MVDEDGFNLLRGYFGVTVGGLCFKHLEGPKTRLKDSNMKRIKNYLVGGGNFWV